MLSSQSQAVLSQVWAKSAPNGQAAGESLIDHTAAVLSRLERLHAILPGLAERVGDDRLWHRAALACLLHDLGKAAEGFQRTLRMNQERWPHRHEVLSLAFLEWTLDSDKSADFAWIAPGIVSHHKDFSRIFRLYPLSDDAEEDSFDPVSELVRDVPDITVRALAEFIGTELPRWLSKARLPTFPIAPVIPVDPVADFRAHAVSRIYRALRQYGVLFHALEREHSDSSSNLTALALRGIVLLADHTASAHVTPPAMPSHGVEEILTRLNLSPDELHDHQRAAADAEGNVLLTAPTGSGKTEAAVLWSVAQRARAGTGRIFYILPYQASINAMYDRLTKVFPGLVTLQHSRSVQALYHRLLETDRYDPAAASKTARFQRCLAHLHFHPIRVLTPYQLLRCAFRLRGYESIIADAANGLFIFDEIHAYEPNRLGMILGMTRYLERSLGGRFIVMSATFPSALRTLLAEALGDSHLINASESLYRRFARHRLEFVAGEIEDESTLSRIVDIASSGQSVLVVCNTVRRSKRVYTALARMLGQAGLHAEILHSRFSSRDRHAKEQRLIARMGTKERGAAAAPEVLVATQVVEVSLDIDFDAIFTEPAPLESLIQRFGRVNRGLRKPPCPVYVLTSPATGQRVYQDAFVAAALDVLLPCNGTVLWESRFGDLLDNVYSGEIERKWMAEVYDSREEFTASCLADLHAFESKPELAERFDRMFDGTEVLPERFRDEYDELMREDPLRASELLVPLPFVQFLQLQRRSLIQPHPEHHVAIALASYTEEGLITEFG